MNQIDSPSILTPLSVVGGAIDPRRDFSWAKWFQQIYQALFRPTVASASLTFGATPAGQFTDVAVAFPANTVATKDLPVVQAPQPPANTCFSWHIVQRDQVVIRLNNYGSAPTVQFTGSFSITILNQ